jgi:acyl carrier protein
MTMDNKDVRMKMAEILHMSVESLQDMTLLTDLVTDSILLVHLVVELQEVFGVRWRHEEMQAVKTVGDLLALVTRQHTR